MSGDDRTQHVIDAIDGALDDWTVSDDAMRWTPEPPEERRPAGLTWQPTLAPPEIAIDWRPMSVRDPRRDPRRDSWHNPTRFIHHNVWPAAAIATHGDAIRQAAEALSRALALDASSIERFAATLAELGREESSPEEAETEDPRARALRLRQQRNTGPDRAPAGQQKRPRRLP